MSKLDDLQEVLNNLRTSVNERIDRTEKIFLDIFQEIDEKENRNRELEAEVERLLAEINMYEREQNGR